MRADRRACPRAGAACSGCSARRRSRPSRRRRSGPAAPRRRGRSRRGAGRPRRMRMWGWWSWAAPSRAPVTAPSTRRQGGCRVATCCGCGSSGSCRPRPTAPRSYLLPAGVHGAFSAGSRCTPASTPAARWRPASGPTCWTPAPAPRCAARCGSCAARSARRTRCTQGATASRSRCETDLAQFDAHCGAGELEQAVALNRGPLLADLDDDWVLEARDEHAERLAAALARLAAAAPDPAKAVSVGAPPARARPARRGRGPRPHAPPGRRRRPPRRADRLRPALGPAARGARARAIDRRPARWPARCAKGPYPRRPGPRRRR